MNFQFKFFKFSKSTSSDGGMIFPIEIQDQDHTQARCRCWQGKRFTIYDNWYNRDIIQTIFDCYAYWLSIQNTLRTYQYDTAAYSLHLLVRALWKILFPNFRPIENKIELFIIGVQVTGAIS